MHQYVFAQIWQAYLISAAVQGALFTCNIKGPYIMARMSRQGKVCVCIFIAMLLFVSSSFSFVYISSVAYPEDVFRNDADRILAQECLDVNYKMLDAGMAAEDNTYKEINEYLSEILGADESALAEQNTAISFEDEIGKLDANEFSALINLLREVEAGDNSSRKMEEVWNCLDRTVADVEDNITAKTDEWKSHDTECGTLEDRLRSFNSTGSDEYKEVNNKLNDAEEKRELARTEKIRYEGYKSVIDINIRNKLEQWENNLDLVLQNNASSIRQMVNEENFSSEKIINEAEQIYDELIDSHVSMEDERLRQYAEFKTNIIRYGEIRKCNSRIEEEIEKLYTRFLDGTSETGEENKTVQQVEVPETEDISQSNLMDGDEWREYWHTRMNAIRENLKDVEFTDGDEKMAYIEEISSLERLYVSDLNNFEKAFTLLCNHPYNGMLKFSFLFAAFMDIFSLVMGILIYFYKKGAEKIPVEQKELEKVIAG